MNSDINKAKELMLQGDYTCVITKADTTYTSRERGVKPLLDWLDMNMDFENSVAADKVVGKAAAFLYVLLKVKEIYAGVLSEPAYKVLMEYNIDVTYGQMVPAIRNRDNTGYCPMESSVWNLDKPEEAYKVILDTRARLSQGK